MKTSAAFLATTELFGTLAAEFLQGIEGEFQRVRLSGGEILFRQGEPGDCLFVVVTGRLRVFVEDPGRDAVALGEVGPGEVVGEMALLTGESRSASVRAIRDTVLLRFWKDDFDRLLARHPAMAMGLARQIAKRNRGFINTLKDGLYACRLSTIALVPLNRNVPLAEFSRRLCKALGTEGAATRISSESLGRESVPGAVRTPDDQDGRVSAWLEDQLTRHRFVLLEADPSYSDWTRRCLRQADRILLVASAADDPEISAVERRMAAEESGKIGALRELVLLHLDCRKQYAGVAQWLACRNCSNCHHVASDEPADCGRLARFLSGKAVGVVLGGGGARGLAHIGVLRALDEAGIKVDIIGGTSMGAFIAAQHAFGMDFKAMIRFGRYCWGKAQPLMGDYTLPFLGLMSGRKFVKIARYLFGDAVIEDLPVKCFLVSSNLTRAEVRAATEGPLWFWVCASMAIPGLFPPLIHGKELYVDGGVLNNLPVDVMRRHCTGTIIAVDVSPLEDAATSIEHAVSPSPWQLIWNKLNPFAEKIRVPGLIDILLRSTTLGSVLDGEEMKKLATVNLHPPVEAFGMLDFDRMEEIVEVGYRHARERLESFPRAHELQAGD